MQVRSVRVAVNEEPDLLADFSFSRPTSQLINAIQQLANSMVINTGKSPSCVNKSISRTSELPTLLLEVAELLKRDCEVNLIESEGDYEFEYRLDLEDAGKSLCIYTRLYSLTQDGSVLYGPVITRPSMQDYSLWVDSD